MEIQKENTEITITLPTNAYFMSGIRDFTLSLIKNTTSFSEKWAFRFQSVVDELCNNAIEHGSKPGGHITITFINHGGESIEIIVEDRGEGKKTTAREMEKLIAEKSEANYVFKELRGRGLTKIVREWTDELEFKDRKDGGLIVRTKKYLRNERYNKNGLEVEGKKSTDPTHLVLTD